VELHVHAGFAKCNAFRFEEFPLQAGVRLSNEQLTAVAHDAVPRDAFP
jgi:hypothetical protein